MLVPNMHCRLVLALVAVSTFVSAQTPRTNVISGRKYARIVIRGALVVDGSGTPMAGPKDIVIENNRIVDVVALDPVALSMGRAKRPAGDVEIDATGKYVLPGLIDAHVHIQDERGGIPQPQQYELNIWLACGITTVRDVGSDTPKTLVLRKRSAAGDIAAPTILVYPMFGAPKTPELARAHVRELKEMGADGIKFMGIQRDIMEAARMRRTSWGCRLRITLASKRPTLGTISNSVRAASSIGTGFRTRRSTACSAFRPTITTTTKPTVSATAGISGAKRIRKNYRKCCRRWWTRMSPGIRRLAFMKPAAICSGPGRNPGSRNIYIPR